MSSTSTTQQHTPGPWSVNRAERFNSERATAIVVPLSVGDCEAAGIEEGYEVIAEICVGPTADADARLIAAAPELAEALRGLLRRSEDLLIEAGMPTTAAGLDYRDAAYEARALLARIEGGADAPAAGVFRG